MQFAGILRLGEGGVGLSFLKGGMASQYRTRGYRPGELVHVTCRGFRRKSIFLDEYDHEEFQQTFRALNERLPPDERLTEHAEARMLNHNHRYLRNGDSPGAITKVMHSTKIRYAQHFNWRYRKRGPVFEKPFRGKVTRTAEHIVNTFAYIHLNPDNTLRMENSSHPVLLGDVDDPYIDPSLAWKAFGDRDGYIDYFNDTERVRNARAAARRRLGDWP